MGVLVGHLSGRLSGRLSGILCELKGCLSGSAVESLVTPIGTRRQGHWPSSKLLQ